MFQALINLFRTKKETKVEEAPYKIEAPTPSVPPSSTIDFPVEEKKAPAKIKASGKKPAVKAKSARTKKTKAK